MKPRQLDTKTQLMNAAITIFHDKGFQKTRVSDIVTEAKVAQGTFYLYFRTKDDIFLQVCAEFKTLFVTFIEGAGELFSGASYGEVEQTMLVFISDLIRLYAENEKMAKIMFYESRNYGGAFRDHWNSIYADFIDIIRRRLERSRTFGHICFEDAETEAAFLVGLFSHSLFYFIELKHSMDIQTLSRRMTAFILGGLSKSKGGAA